MAESIFDRINLMERNATKQDRAIISFLKENNVSALSYLSITEFANNVGVAESTLLRFCRKLGLRGYSEFRMLLARSHDSEYAENTEDYAARILNSMTTALRSTYELVDRAELEKAAEILLSAKRIYSLGSGNSGVAAEELRNKLLRFGMHVFHLRDSHFQSIAVSTLTQDDALILFSVSGSTKDMIGIAQAARQNHCKLIIITNYLRSPLGAYADVPLYVVAKSAPLDSGSLVAKISQLYVVDLLASTIFRSREREAFGNMERTAIAVLDKEI